MPTSPLYLDHNATTPLLPEVLDAMLPWLRDGFGNPSSDHPYGRRARAAVESARASVAALVGCEADEIFFTSGGTESNNLALFGVTEALPAKRHVVTSRIEHPATANPCRWLEKHGWRLSFIGVDRSGSVSAADVLVHTDAAQSAGKIPLDELGVDLLSIAGHKLNAPKGVGALYVRRGTPIVPFALGAGHERGLRPGTENVASIAGLGAACELARERLGSHSARMRGLTDALRHRLGLAIEGLELASDPVHRLPNTLNLLFPGVSGSSVLAHTPEIAASTGSACHAGHEEASAILLAQGIEPGRALGAVRLSLGVTTTEQDVARAAEAIARGWARATQR